MVFSNNVYYAYIIDYSGRRFLMIIKYEFGGDDIHPSDDFEFWAVDDEVDYVIQKELFRLDRKELVDLILWNVDREVMLDYFEKEIKETFEEDARQDYLEEN